MKRWKIIAILLLCLALTGTVACRPGGSSGDEEEFTGQLVEVVRGDLTVSVSGNGSIDVSNEVRLAFDGGGEVYRIYVEQGDEGVGTFEAFGGEEGSQGHQRSHDKPKIAHGNAHDG